jgi:hypothetical protein
VQRRNDPQSYNRYAYARDNPLRYVDPTGHQYGPEIPDPEEIEASFTTSSDPPPSPLPSSYVRIKVFYKNTTHEPIRGGAGVVIDTNAILTHNHLLFSGETFANIKEIQVTYGSRVWTFDPNEFLMTGDAELGGGLGLLVFESDFMAATDVVPLGDADELKMWDRGEMPVVYGAEPDGLYPVQVSNTDQRATNIRGIDYIGLAVWPRRTTQGDSGAPLYVDGCVYGVNNARVCGSVTNITAINAWTEKLTRILRRGMPNDS